MDLGRLSVRRHSSHHLSQPRGRTATTEQFGPPFLAEFIGIRAGPAASAGLGIAWCWCKYESPSTVILEHWFRERQRAMAHLPCANGGMKQGLRLFDLAVLAL